MLVSPGHRVKAERVHAAWLVLWGPGSSTSLIVVVVSSIASADASVVSVVFIKVAPALRASWSVPVVSIVARFWSLVWVPGC